MEKWEALFQIVASLFRLIVIIGSRPFKDHTSLIIASAICSHASLSKYILTQHLAHVKRNKFPEPPKI